MALCDLTLTARSPGVGVIIEYMFFFVNPAWRVFCIDRGKMQEKEQ